MTLSDEDRRRIEEEEYRKLARERLERTVRIEADIRTSGDQRVEVRGLGTEIYHDAKGAAKGAARSVKTFVFGSSPTGLPLESRTPPAFNGSANKFEGFVFWLVAIGILIGILFAAVVGK